MKSSIVPYSLPAHWRTGKGASSGTPEGTTSVPVGTTCRPLLKDLHILTMTHCHGLDSLFQRNKRNFWKRCRTDPLNSQGRRILRVSRCEFHTDPPTMSHMQFEVMSFSSQQQRALKGSRRSTDRKPGSLKATTAMASQCCLGFKSPSLRDPVPSQPLSLWGDSHLVLNHFNFIYRVKTKNSLSESFVPIPETKGENKSRKGT